MANTPRPIFQISNAPGFARDGTLLDRTQFIDGQWTRFQRGRPKKMGGFKEMASNIEHIIRGSYVFYRNGLVYIYGFGDNTCWLTVTTQNASSSVASETALTGLAAGDSYTYQIDSIFDATGSGTNRIIVHPAQNLSDISNATDTNLYIAEIGANPPTFAKMQDGDGGYVTVSGGLVVLQPYVFAYGNDGVIKNSNPNNPNSWIDDEANEVNVSATKIVKGLPIRGGSNAPAGLFWALDSLIRVSRIGANQGFRYDTVSSQTSILSPSSAIEYDGIHYWIGIDRFLMYDGTVKEVPNRSNYNWFFDNVNYTQRSKIFAVKVTKYGEIWWFFPYGDAEECTHAIIYNVRENIWYDNRCARSSGYFSQVFRYPVMFDNVQNVSDGYSVLAHEFGKNAIQNNNELAIAAHFETSDFGYPTGGADGEKPTGIDRWTRLTRIEPDFIQTGEMSVTTTTQEFANSAEVASDPLSFDNTTEMIDVREHGRSMRLRFDSNALGGDFEMGRVIIHTEPGDARS